VLQPVYRYEAFCLIWEALQCKKSSGLCAHTVSKALSCFLYPFVIDSFICSIKISGKECMWAIGVRGGGRGGRPPPLSWKISGQTLFSGQMQVAQKSWMIKNISIQWKISGPLCFSRQAQVAQKSWVIKIYIQYSEFRTHFVFQGKRKLLKNPECKSIFNTVKIFRANCVFQGKRKLLKNPEW